MVILFETLVHAKKLEDIRARLRFEGCVSIDCVGAGIKISDIFVDIFSIYPISMMFNTISAMTDISSIYRFWIDISWKYQVCGTRVR